MPISATTARLAQTIQSTLPKLGAESLQNMERFLDVPGVAHTAGVNALSHFLSSVGQAATKDFSPDVVASQHALIQGHAQSNFYGATEHNQAKSDKDVLFPLAFMTFHAIRGLDAGLDGDNNLDRLGKASELLQSLKEATAPQSDFHESIVGTLELLRAMPDLSPQTIKNAFFLLMPRIDKISKEMRLGHAEPTPP